MKTYFTTVKYAPNPDREEFFGIGLIMVSPESGAVRVRFSQERVARINRALGIDKSSLLESTMHQAEGLAKSGESVDVKHLEYLSVYENGVIRYSAPKSLVIAHDNPNESADAMLDQRFDRLYHKLIADKKESNASVSRSNNAFAAAFRKQAKKNEQFKRHFDIGYSLDSVAQQSDTLFPGISFDFIGGTGSSSCGNFIDLEVQEKTLQKNIAETFLVRNFLTSLYRSNSSQCKIILDKRQAKSNSARKALHSIELGLQKEPDNLIVVSDSHELIEKVLNEVDEKGVVPFSRWIQNHPLNTSYSSL